MSRLFVYTRVRKVKHGYLVVQIEPHSKGMAVSAYPVKTKQFAQDLADSIHRKRAELLYIARRVGIA